MFTTARRRRRPGNHPSSVNPCHNPHPVRGRSAWNCTAGANSLTCNVSVMPTHRNHSAVAPSLRRPTRAAPLRTLELGRRLAPSHRMNVVCSRRTDRSAMAPPLRATMPSSCCQLSLARGLRAGWHALNEISRSKRTRKRSAPQALCQHADKPILGGLPSVWYWGALTRWPAVRPVPSPSADINDQPVDVPAARKDTCSLTVRGLSDLHCTCAASPAGTRGCGQSNHRGGVFHSAADALRGASHFFTVRRDRRPRPSAVPRVRREKPGRHHSSAGIVWAAVQGVGSDVASQRSERAGVGFVTATHLGLPADFSPGCRWNCRRCAL